MSARIQKPQFPLILLLAAAITATLLPFVAFSTYSIYVRERGITEQQQRQLSDHALAISNAVDRELQNQIALAQVTATNFALWSGDIKTFWANAAEISKVVHGHFVITDASMQQLINTRVPVGSPLPQTVDSSSVEYVLKSGAPQIGNLDIGAVAKEPLFAIRVPATISGSSKYVLSYVAPPDAILQVIKNTSLPEGWFAAVADKNGVIVARSHRHEDFYGKRASTNFTASLEGEAGLINSTDLEGRATLTAYRKAPNSRWIVAVWAPRQILEVPAQRSRQIVYIALVFSFLVSTMAALAANYLVRRPTLRLKAAAENLADGKEVSYEPSLMTEANVVGAALSHASQVISKREQALLDREQHLSVVIRELSHRTKNLLAVIQAMARQTMKRAGGAYLDAFEQRLAALARSHDLLVGTNWSYAELGDVIRSQTETFRQWGEDSIKLDGPPICLTPEAAQTIGMALHELATNAVKHGALSAFNGWVDVHWRIEANSQGTPILRLQWREQEGPQCEQPQSKGFGHAVLTKVVPNRLMGRATLTWHSDGCEWILEAPFSMVSSDAITLPLSLTSSSPVGSDAPKVIGTTSSG